MPKTLCEICDNDKFENINGFYYCTVCNTQSKNLRDIELHEDEDVKHSKGQKEIIHGIGSKSKSIKEEPKDEINIDASFSTYHVINYLLCAQANDLVKLGVNSSIRNIIFNLWTKYLQKIGVAFLPNNSLKLNESNIKWESLQKLLEQSEDVKDVKTIIKLEAKPELIEANEKINDPNEDESNSENELDEEIPDDEALNETSSKSQILLHRFEWVRMPHTIAILNLSLLLIKSNLLITDLIRFVKSGKISYFNIDSVLPPSMSFSYGDDATMFNTHVKYFLDIVIIQNLIDFLKFFPHKLYTTPSADYLRYLTSKLGQFLELETIQIVPIKEITSRFLIDLNLPIQFQSLVNSLLEKIKPINEFDLTKAEYENLEAIALSYIYVIIVIIYQYDANLSRLDPNDLEDNRYFYLSEWITNMQNRLHDLKAKLKTDMRDLSSYKPTIIKHRYNMNAKAYITQYRQNEIKKALRAPLEDTNEKEESFSIDLVTNLAFINEKTNPLDFKHKSLGVLLTEEKLKLISDKQFRSSSFKSFAKDNLQTYELKAKYLIGLEVNTFDWLLEMFQCIAQSTSFVKMFRYVDNLLNKLNKKKI